MKIFNYIFIVCLAMGAISCTGSLEDVNTDPSRLSEVDLRLLLPEVEAQAANNMAFNPPRVAGIIMQQYQGLDAQQLDYNNYILGEDVMNNYWRTALYSGVLKSAQVLNDQAVAEGNSSYAGVAKVIFASQLADAASMFGDIPNTEALQGLTFVQPSYDSQESVYTAALNMIDAGIADLTAGGADGLSGGGDIIYGGNVANWLKAANGLKARYLMHTVKRNPGNAALALAAANASFTSNAENASFPFSTAQNGNNPLAAFGQERPNTLGVHPNFVTLLEGDPRATAYYVEVEGVLQYFDLGNSDLVWAQDDSAMPLISYTEVMFIKAEAEAMAGGDASASLEAAVQSSMDLNGVSAADAAAYIGGLGNASIQTIVEEAYKAYFGFNFLQTWTNYRRTGFPALTPAADASPSFNPSGVIPQRYLYVTSETQTNSANVEAAAANQGGALLDNTLWAFQ